MKALNSDCTKKRNPGSNQNQSKEEPEHVHVNRRSKRELITPCTPCSVTFHCFSRKVAPVSVGAVMLLSFLLLCCTNGTLLLFCEALNTTPAQPPNLPASDQIPSTQGQEVVELCHGVI